MSEAHTLLVGDRVSRSGEDLLRVIALYEGADEIVVETLDEEGLSTGDIFDICWFDVELVARES